MYFYLCMATIAKRQFKKERKLKKSLSIFRLNAILSFSNPILCFFLSNWISLLQSIVFQSFSLSLSLSLSLFVLCYLLPFDLLGDDRKFAL